MEHLETARRLFFEGLSLVENNDFQAAEIKFLESLALVPDRVSTLTNLSAAQIKLKKYAEAKYSAMKAISLDDANSEAWLNLGIINQYGNNPNQTEALACYGRAIALCPDYAEAHNNLGGLLSDLGRLEEAEVSLRQAIKIKPDFLDAYGNLGTVLAYMGKMDEAEIILSQAMALAPGDARPLANALVHMDYQPDDQRFGQLETVYARRESLPLDDRVRLDFAMGRAMENTGRYDRAFAAYAEGNRLHFQAHPFNEAAEERFVEDICRRFTRELFGRTAALAESLPPPQDRRVPVFIVGMPRSGSTLIEQMLSSHPAVFGAGELETFGAASLPGDPAKDKDDVLKFRELGQAYLDRVWKPAPPGTRYVADKTLSNFYHLGLIHLMLPNARIIHSVRDPMDTCFSCYALRFSHGQEYTYDLGALGRQYRRYMKLMQHWHDVLPLGRILDVRYEDNIADAEHEVARMLDYLGLPWDPACLRFYENGRAVRTASVVQVRKPIYASSVSRWKHYEQNLGPLLEAIYSPSRV